MKEFLENLSQEKISFNSHFYKKAKRRPINEGMIRGFLSNPKKLERIEKGKQSRFKLWFRMSRKYSLVLIIEINSSKHLRIISAWNTSRRWQRKLR